MNYKHFRGGWGSAVGVKEEKCIINGEKGVKNATLYAYIYNDFPSYAII